MPEDEWLHREAFMAYLDVLKKSHEIRYDAALAEAADLPHTTVVGWRNGRGRPSPAELVHLAKALNADAYVLAAVAGVPVQRAPSEELRHPTARKIDFLLGPNSPLPGAERVLLEAMFEHLLWRYRDVLDKPQDGG